jgi:hypothetical protein
MGSHQQDVQWSIIDSDVLTALIEVVFFLIPFQIATGVSESDFMSKRARVVI